jgi:hypothetical protein
MVLCLSCVDLDRYLNCLLFLSFIHSFLHRRVNVECPLSLPLSLHLWRSLPPPPFVFHRLSLRMRSLLCCCRYHLRFIPTMSRCVCVCVCVCVSLSLLLLLLSFTLFACRSAFHHASCFAIHTYFASVSYISTPVAHLITHTHSLTLICMSSSSSSISIFLSIVLNISISVVVSH